MRLLLVLCVSASVLAVGGAAHAEGPRYVRTSLDAAAEPQHPMPPRVIMATLDGGSATVGTEIAPRSFRRSLEEASAPVAPAPEGTPQASSVAGFPPVDAAAVATAPVDGAPAVASAVTVEPAQLAPAEPPLGEGYRQLECDCTRSGRQIRITLDGPSEVPELRPRVIRVQL